MAVAFNGMKVFSATMVRDRDGLGERVTEWIRDNPRCQIVDIVVKQSSDNAFHCLSILLLFHEETKKRS